MQSDPGSKEETILQNIKNEACIAQDKEGMFFSALEAKGNPTSSSEALTFAQSVVNENSADLLFTGTPAPDSGFERLFRLTNTNNLRYVFTPAVEIQYGSQINQPDLDSDSLKLISAEISSQNDQINLGANNCPVVWATGYSDIQQRFAGYNLGQAVPRELIKTLGLGVLKNETRCLVLLYDRGTIKLHAPRVFDALSHEAFQPTADCSSFSGKTKHLDDSTIEGIPEIIHSFCTPGYTGFEVGEIN